MYRNRLIPCLLLQGEGLVKTIKFKKPIYLGDPINAVRIFNDKSVDEIILLDIDATKEGRGPDFTKIEKIVDQCFMPICYGGGVNNVEDIRKLLSIGIEKVALGASAYHNPQMVRTAVKMFGSSTMVGVMDIDYNNMNQRTVRVVNGSIDIEKKPIEYAKYLESLGIGELLINDIYNDGVMNGYDTDFVASISDIVKIPVVACGGAGKLQDCYEVIRKGASAAAAGSIFVFYGRLKAVLINYPEES